MSVSERAGQLMVGAVVLCAIIMTTVVVLDRVAPRKAGAYGAKPPTRDPIQVSDWEKYARVGHRMGPETAPVTIVEFGDFECPACRRFEVGALRAIRAEFPTQVALIFRHWPLPYHRLSYPSARASECAASQGKFAEIHDLFYKKQDSLGVKSFPAFARDAGVPDSIAFFKCFSDTAAVAAISADTVAVLALGGTGTPTVMINGLLLGSLPDSAKLEKLVRERLPKATQ